MEPRRTTESHQTNFTLMNCIAYSERSSVYVCLFNPLFRLPLAFIFLETSNEIV